MIAFEAVFLTDAGFFVGAAIFLVSDLFGADFAFAVVVFTAFLTGATFDVVTFFLVTAFLTVADFFAFGGDFFATVFFAVLFFFVVAILSSLFISFKFQVSSVVLSFSKVFRFLPNL